MNMLFAEVFEDSDSYASRRPSDEYLRDLLGRKEFIALAAFGDDHMIGAQAAYELVKFEAERSEIYTYDLAVRAEYRRRGVATMLIEALKPIAKTRGAWVIYVQADPPDAPAVALYDKLGTREEVYQFDISVSGGR